MKHIYLFAALLCGFICTSQSWPPTDECPAANSLYNSPDGLCFQAATLRSVFKPNGVVADSLVVRGTGLYGQLNFIAPLRTHFSITTTGSGNATYNSSTGVFNIPNNTPTRTINNNVSRSVNSNFTISTTRDSQVSYSMLLSATNPLLAGTSTASAFLEYSTDGGSNWTTVSQCTNASQVTITVSVQITQAGNSVLSGIIPANALVRIRTATGGTASATYTRGQEVLL